MKPKELKTTIGGKIFSIGIVLFFSCSTIYLIIAGKILNSKASLIDDIVYLVISSGAVLISTFMFISFSKTLFITSDGIGEKSITGKKVVFIRWDEVKEVDVTALEGKTLWDSAIPSISIKRVKGISVQTQINVVFSSFSKQDQKEIMEELKNHIPAEKFVDKRDTSHRWK